MPLSHITYASHINKYTYIYIYIICIIDTFLIVYIFLI
jgi:hypothetical protein